MMLHFLLALGICTTPFADCFSTRQLAQSKSPENNKDKLVVGYTSNYALAWNDRGSGGRRDGSLYVPLVQSGYALVGTLAVSGYSAPTKNVIVLHSKRSAFAKPALFFTQVYADHGTGAYRDGSVWRPICPPGYYSVSDFGQAGYNWSGSLYAGVEIRPCIFYTGVVACSSESVWDDKGTGGHQDIAFWKFRRSGPGGAETSSDGFFRATGNYDHGPTGSLSYCINPSCISASSMTSIT